MSDSPGASFHEEISKDRSALPIEGTLSQASAPEDRTLLTETAGFAPAAEAGPGMLPAIPGYELLGVLGRGGMGVVYRARQIKANRLVALKMVRAGSHADAGELARFRSEAEAIARLQHPHIVQVFEVGEHEGQPFFSLEYCGGGSLAHQLRGTPLQPREAAGVVEVLAAAVHAAHQKGIIHRDLKPANVLVQRDEAASGDGLVLSMLKISDFGLAKKVEDAGQTASGVILGTPSYMAPEQAKGESSRIGPAADVYALGVILYELLTGRPPFRAATSVDTILQVLRDEPVPPRQLQPRTPRDLETICLKCLHKEAARRYATAAELAADLGRYRRHEPIQARPVGVPERAVKWVRRRPAAALLLAVAVAAPLIALLLAGFYLDRQRQFNQQLQGERNKALEQKDRAEQNESKAKQKQIEADKQKQLAQGAYRDSQLRLMQMHVSRGVRLMEDGDPFQALPWLVAALQEDPRDEAVRQMHRYRIGALLRQAPRLTRMFFQPASRVYHVEFSPDGRKLLLSGDDHTVGVWDVTEDKILYPPLRHEGPARIAASFSSGGDRVLTVSGDPQVRLWDAATGKADRTLTFPRGAQDACFSPDGKRLVVSAGRVVRVWDARTGAAVSPPLEHTDQILDASFSNDGHRIVTTCKDGAVGVWNADTGQRVTPALRRKGTGRPPGALYKHAILCPDGKQLATIGNDGGLCLWQLGSGTGDDSVRPVWEADKAGAAEACFSPDGSRLVSWGYIRAKVWDARTGARVGPDLQHNGQVGYAAFSPDGRRVVTTSQDRTARIWDATTGALAYPPLPHASGVIEADFSPDGRFLATACKDGARVWDLNRDKPLATWSGLPKLRDLSPDTRYVVALDPLRHAVGPDGVDRGVFLLDSKSGIGIAHWLLDAVVGYVSFSPDSRRIVATCADKTARLWDIASRKECCPPLKHDSEVLIAAVNADGTRLAAGCKDGTVHVWDLSTCKECYPSLRHAAGVYSLRFSADGRLLLTAGRDARARVWDAATGRPLGPFVPHGVMELANGYLYGGGPAWGPGGKHLATAAAGFTARAWDATTGQPVGPPLDHSGGLVSLAFRPDGGRLLSTSNDCTALQWDVTTGKRLTPAMRHGGFVRHGTYSPDGRRIATVDPSTLRVWDAATGLPLLPPVNLARGGFLLRSRFSPDGRRLFHWNGHSNTMTIWDVSRDDRPLEGLVKLTHLLTGHQLDSSGVLTPLTRDQQCRLWQDPCLRAWRPAEEARDWKARGHKYLTQWDSHTRQPALAQADLEQAIAAYTRSLALDPRNQEAWFERGQAYFMIAIYKPSARTTPYEHAVKDFYRAVALGMEEDVRLFYMRGSAYAEMKQWDKAAADLARAIKRKPGISSYWGLLAKCQIAMKDLDGYRRTCAGMVKQFGGSDNLLIVLGVGNSCTLAPGAPLEFTESFEKKLAMAWASLSNMDDALGPLYYRMGKYRKALERLNMVENRRRSGHKTKCCLFLAMSHHKLGHAEEAKKWFDAAEHELAKSANAYWRKDWRGEIPLQALHREAKKLLNEKKK